MAGPRVDEDLTLRILSDAADFADEDVVGVLSRSALESNAISGADVCATSEPPNARTAAATNPLSVRVIAVS